LGLGFLGFLNKAAVFALMGAGLLAGVVRFRPDFSGQLTALLEEVKRIRFSWFDRLLIFILFLHAAGILVVTLSPEIFFDSLVYHLGVPAFYLQEGRVVAEPSNFSSAFPILMQMLYTAGLILSDDTLAKLIHFATGLFLMGTLFTIGRRYVSVTAGLLACVIFCSMPMASINLSATGVEVGSAWFTALAVYALLLFSARERSEPRVFDRTLLLAGIFAGLACGTKYPALFTVIAGAAVIFCRRPAEAGGRDTGLAVKQSLMFGTAAGLVFSPWPLKNIFFHGNPLFPFFTKFLPGGSQVDPFKWAVFNGDCFSRDLPAVFKSFTAFFHFIFHPWYITMSGMSTPDFLGPFFLLCVPLPFLFRLKKPALRHLAVFGAVMLALWYVSTSMPRYFLPGLAVFSVLFAALITESGSGALRWTMQSVLIITSLYSIQHFGRIAAAQQGWQVVFGLQDKAAYLSRQHDTYPAPYYSAMEYINSALPLDGKVMFLGETRSFYCRRRFLASAVYDVHPLVLMARESATPEELQAKISAAGITHLFLNLGEGMRLADGYRLFQWDERSLKVFNAWWERNVELVWSDARTETRDDFRLLFVYKIDAAGRPAPVVPPRNYVYDLYLRGLKK
ncbi:MAG: glycosyltransferase family 39 protein, partial [Elusimicrobiota bacterium]